MEELNWGCCVTNESKDDSYITCLKCKKRFHYACMSLDDNSFSPEMENVWTCPECVRQVRKGFKNDNTPVRNVSTSRVNKRLALNSPVVEKEESITRESVCSIVQNCLSEVMKDSFAKLNESIKLNIQNEMKPLREELITMNTSMTLLLAQYEELKAECSESKRKITALEVENNELKSNVCDLQLRCNNIEQRLRQNNIEIQCIPEHKNENLLSIINNLATVVGCELDSKEILNFTRTAKANRTSTRSSHMVDYDYCRASKTPGYKIVLY
ncbi:unnamed protein product [Leptosia nina]|uniref:PHD-type domain-containing protein n=1 Tax=Leptosia nina TaxID=320188 RepID=A0AAV1K0L8_9NEOP